MGKYSLIVFVALVSLCAGVRAQDGEGYFLTPDKVRIFYKIEGSRAENHVFGTRPFTLPDRAWFSTREAGGVECLPLDEAS
jgi:hypothetical protein